MMTALGGRYLIDLPSAYGWSLVEVRVRLDWVEIWHDEHCVGVFDRNVLHDWLTRPDGALTTDEITLLVMREGHIALKLHRAGTWTLGADILAGLRNVV